MNKIHLAVISDIHVGDGARARDLCPEKNSKGVPSAAYTDQVDDRYQQKFIHFVRDRNITADYLLLPGDVTHEAQPDEVKIASGFVAAAAAALEVKRDNIIFVPGNHDVDWAVLKLADSTGLRSAQRYDPIRHKDFHFNEITRRGSGSLFEAPHFTVWNYDDLLAVGYNSSHHDHPDKQHFGLIDPAHAEELRKMLGGLQYSKTQLRLFLVHHHPLQYSSPTADAPDLSIMVNAEQLHHLLREFKFDILVHGHEHLPRFSTYSIEGSSEVAILCSGSFSVKIDTKWAGVVSNQFHLIKIEGRDEEEQLIFGHVESWSYYYAKGWVPSEAQYDGIPHIEPFGTYIRPGQLEALIRPIVESRLSSHDYVEWSWVLTQEPHLRHIRPEILVRVIDSLAAAGNFRRIHDTPAKIILLKTV